MRLEDTITSLLFSPSYNMYTSPLDDVDFIIECKAEKDKPIPLCVAPGAFETSDLVYSKLYLSDSLCHERSTPRALYNFLFSGSRMYNLTKVKVKESVYYYAYGVLFNYDKIPLFYFAYERTFLLGTYVNRPRLYLTPTLLHDASCAEKPMEKFFMSTIVPYLIGNKIIARGGWEFDIIIEIDNNIDNTFFIPRSSLIESTPITNVNSKLNDILADNSDVLSEFLNNYSSV